MTSLEPPRQRIRMDVMPRLGNLNNTKCAPCRPVSSKLLIVSQLMNKNEITKTEKNHKSRTITESFTSMEVVKFDLIVALGK